jgi:hypothetical protein
MSQLTVVDPRAVVLMHLVGDEIDARPAVAGQCGRQSREPSRMAAISLCDEMTPEGPDYGGNTG